MYIFIVYANMYTFTQQGRLAPHSPVSPVPPRSPYEEEEDETTEEEEEDEGCRPGPQPHCAEARDAIDKEGEKSEVRDERVCRLLQYTSIVWCRLVY
jgi:hypothetical protein